MPLIRNIKIKKFIIHDIPRKPPGYSIGELEPTLSEVESKFSPELESFFKEKLVSSVGSSNAFKIRYKKDIIEESVPNYLEAYFSDEQQFIHSSQMIAKKLFEEQNARNSEGLLVFILCESGVKNMVAILKVEREEGVQIESVKNSEGKKTFDMSIIENLMLTNKTKLYKSVLFYKESSGTQGLLSDNQIGNNTTSSYANFFLDNFLDCELVEESAQVTKSFYEETMSFINSGSIESHEMSELTTHLVSELKNNQYQVDIDRFVQNSFSQELVDQNIADEYISLITKTLGVTTFVKNTVLIENKIKQNRIKFDSGISIDVPLDISSEVYSIENFNGKVKVQIEDDIDSIR